MLLSPISITVPGQEKVVLGGPSTYCSKSLIYSGRLVNLQEPYLHSLFLHTRVTRCNEETNEYMFQR